MRSVLLSLLLVLLLTASPAEAGWFGRKEITYEEQQQLDFLGTPACGNFELTNNIDLSYLSPSSPLVDCRNAFKTLFPPNERSVEATRFVKVTSKYKQSPPNGVPHPETGHVTVPLRNNTGRCDVTLYWDDESKAPKDGVMDLPGQIRMAGDSLLGDCLREKRRSWGIKGVPGDGDLGPVGAGYKAGLKIAYRLVSGTKDPVYQRLLRELEQTAATEYYYSAPSYWGAP